MLFNSVPFVIFFLVVFTLYYLPAARRIQVPMLVCASFVFYCGAAPLLLLLLLLSIAINAVTSFQVNKAERAAQIGWAAGGVAANLAILGFFKYGALLSRLLTQTLGAAHVSVGASLLSLPLPVGISFYTFEGVSLLVDVLRQRASGAASATFVDRQAGRHVLKTSLFIAFFPHLIAGPILKARQFYPQIGVKFFGDIDWTRVFRCLVTGYFLKMVVADNLKDYTFWIAFPYFQKETAATNLALLFGYSMQIFADFAGYSLIALGLAAAFGYTLPDNFLFPYLSRSLSEFWRRWHISLSTWLRDYLYFPLGGNRKGRLRTYVNLLLVMTLGGLWHGAAWSYAVWGLFHGAGLAAERLVRDRIGVRSAVEDDLSARWGLRDFVKLTVTFAFVTGGWLLFKLPDFDQTRAFVAALAQNARGGPDLRLFLPVAVFSLPVIVYHAMNLPSCQAQRAAWAACPRYRWCRDAAFGLMLTALLFNSGTSSEFIYFQF